MGSVNKCAVSVLLIFPLFLTCVLALTDHHWESWKSKHDKDYSDFKEEEYRRGIWGENYVAFKELSGKSKSFSVSLNYLADHKISELVSLNYRSRRQDFSSGKEFVDKTDVDLPKAFDWRKKGVVTPVINQEEMGQVVAVVATECVETFHAIHTGRLVELSCHQTSDCCCSPRTHQCMGGLDVFRCIHKHGGLCSQKGYTPTPQSQCNDTCDKVAQIDGGAKVQSGNETALQVAALKTGVMVFVDASHLSFQMYQSGVYDEPACSSTLLDHALQVVGYGTLDGKDYWICRNSWGINWGMQGYILMSRNHGNQCGIATEASYPV